MKDSTKSPKGAFPTMGTSAAHASVAKPEQGTLVKKKNTQSGDPAIKDAKVKPHAKVTSGARYGIKVKFQKTTAPEAGAVQANGRILPSAVKRSAPNFSAGMADHN